MRTKVLTHRGLDPDKSGYFPESSREAFADQLMRGFGLEFDPRITADGGLIVLHDSTLARITDNKDTRAVSDVPLAELLAMDVHGSHLIDFPSLLNLIKEHQAPDALSAIHLKHGSQDPRTLDLMLEALRDAAPVPCIIFDTTIEAAQYIESKDPSLHLAPSVAHPYDIERYNSATGGTLYTIEEAMKHRDLFDWVWLDEWDLADANGGTKHLYRQEAFDMLRAAGFSIGLVTPELHGTSPGLLGGEAHPDARDNAFLEVALKNIVALSPDIICTDHPDLVRSLGEKI